METLLIILIVLLSCVIVALAGFWFVRGSKESEKNMGPQQTAKEIAHRPHRNAAWDHAVRSGRNRNW